jgi:uncharacterized protein (TIGR03437 family)
MVSSSKKFAWTLIGALLLAGTAFGQATVSILSGNGQIVLQNNTGSNPLVVVVRDASGNPIPNAKVNWSITGVQNQTGSLLLATSTTDATGTTGGGCATGGTGGCQKFVTPTLPPINNGFAQSTITATAGAASVSFVETTEGLVASGAPGLAPTLLHPVGAEQPLTGPAGQVAKTPIQIRVLSAVNSTAVPRVLVTFSSDTSSQTSAACSGGNPFTDSTGLATCNLILGGKVGPGTLTAAVGGVVGQNLSVGLGTYSIPYKVLVGPPGVIKTVSGDQQTGNPGQLLPQALVAQVTDLGGNPLPGVSVVFEPVVAGSVTLSDVRATSDAFGHIQARATPGNVNGQVQVRVRTSDGAVAATFIINVNLIVGSLTKVSGDQQAPAIVGTAFTDPLIVQVNDTSNQPLPGTPVNFAVTSGAGTATLGTTNAVADAQGRAGTTVSAGSTAGPIVVTATVTSASGPVSVQFNLSSRLPGPQCTEGSTFFNGASFKANWISPGATVTIYCSGIADNVQGVVAPSLFGPLPYQIAGVTVKFGDTPAPLYNLVNVNGVESVTVQVPLEAAVGGDTVTISANGGSTAVNATILESAPGFFEWGDLGPDNRRMAVVLRPDGSVVSATNPILRGEIGRAFVTGLIAPAGLGTNALAPLDSDIAITSGVVTGINNAGVPTISVTYAHNLVGIWEVQFKVPDNAKPGLRDPFALAMITSTGKRVYTQPSVIAVK